MPGRDRPPPDRKLTSVAPPGGLGSGASSRCGRPARSMAPSDAAEATTRLLFGRLGLTEQAFVIKAVLQCQGRARTFRGNMYEVRVPKRSLSSEKAPAPHSDGCRPEGDSSGLRPPHRLCACAAHGLGRHDSDRAGHGQQWQCLSGGGGGQAELPDSQTAFLSHECRNAPRKPSPRRRMDHSEGRTTFGCNRALVFVKVRPCHKSKHTAFMARTDG